MKSVKFRTVVFIHGYDNEIYEKKGDFFGGVLIITKINEDRLNPITGLHILF